MTDVPPSLSLSVQLANSHTFQQLALRLHLNIKAVQEKGRLRATHASCALPRC
jgi:hypothetical protein